jgi:hypothetical protein
MPTPTYTPLANITLSTSTSSVAFSSISQIYRDLVLVISAKEGSTSTNAYITLNSDSGTNYVAVYALGNGSTASSEGRSGTSYRLDWNGSITTSSNAMIVNIMEYSTTNKQKAMITRVNNASTGVEMSVGKWANTSAVTRIDITADHSLVAGTTMALYGIVS